MVQPITAAQFHQADGVEDWRVLAEGACAHFRTGSFAAGVALVDALTPLAEAADHHPDVDLRYAGVTVRLLTHEVDALTARDVALARQISSVARELGIRSDPGAVQTVRVVVDALVPAEVTPFWRALLGYREQGPEDLLDPHGRAPGLRFRQRDAAGPERSAGWIELSVPHDRAETRVAAAVEAGGRVLDDRHAPARWLLADPEGHEASVVTGEGPQR